MVLIFAISLIYSIFTPIYLCPFFQDYNVEIVQAPYFTKTPISQYFPSAKTVRIDCLAEGIPSPEITWLKDGVPIELGGRINYKKTKNSEKMLILSHTFTMDSGNLTD